MLVDTFINPLNLPNLLTPFRYNLEIQYVIFSILFISLLGYVIFIFIDEMSSLDKILIILGIFIVLLFLFLVIKERDRLDELTLQEEAVDMAQELATIERDIKLKDFLKDEAKKGIIYDENDNRIEKGKADTAKVNNLRSEINKLETRKKEILEKQKNFDSTFLQEAKGQVESSAESEMNQLTKRNRDLEKKIERITGSSSDRLETLLSQKADIEIQLGQAREKANNDKNDPVVKALSQELKAKQTQIRNEEDSLGNIEISANTRVELDRARREMKELRSRAKKVEGLYGNSDVMKRDINVIKKNEIYKAEEEFNQANEAYKKAEALRRINDTTENKNAVAKAAAELNKTRNKFNSLSGNQKFDAANRGISKAESLINTYDQSTDGRAMENKYKQVGVYQKLEGLQEEAEKASKLSKSAADLATAFKGTEQEKIEALVRNVREYVPKQSNLSKDKIREELSKSGTDQEKAETALALVTAERNIYERGISGGSANTANSKNQASQEITRDLGALMGESDNVKYATALLKNLSNKELYDAKELIKAEDRINRGASRAERDTYNLIFNKDKQNIKERLGNQIYTTDNYGNRNIKGEYSAVKNKKESNFLENVETFDRLIADDAVPGSYDPGTGDAILNNVGNVRTKGNYQVGTTYEGYNLKDIRDLVYQLSSQLKENPGIDTGYPNRKVLEKILRTQKEWFQTRGI